ncbi:hypothetical protein [Chryseobacterium sp. 5_R23647]|uniref:hypothetical protein n=1 Tax=Chryseobacterium sp. 5_R23647 TaxID=2258964 RepID=UPI000F50B121|nr:hypothetical protein [Chryseobacterium sp. 5_R23647]
MARIFTENEFNNLKKEIEDFKIKYPNLKNPNIIYLSYEGDQDSLKFGNQVNQAFQNEGLETRYISAVNVGTAPTKDFSVSNWIDDSLFVEIHPTHK